MSLNDISCLTAIPDTHTIRKLLALRSAESKVLRKLLRAAESKKVLFGESGPVGVDSVLANGDPAGVSRAS